MQNLLLRKSTCRFLPKINCYWI